MALKDKILIVGGYGQVGQTVSEVLGKKYPSKLIVAGRDSSKAKVLIKRLNIEATASTIDLNESEPNEINLKEVQIAICCIEFLKNDNFIQSCIQNGIHYTEIATSYEAYQRFLKYRTAINNAGICVVPGVGLMPGMSAVFAKRAVSKLGEVRQLKSYVLLGLGEEHGLDALRWMIQYANQDFMIKTDKGLKHAHSFTDPEKERLLDEEISRKFYRFNFGDQHIIPRIMNVKMAETRLAFDIPFISFLFRLIKGFGLMPMLEKINPKNIRKALNSFRIGTKKFAVQTHCYQKETEFIYLIKGLKEARATGLIAAYTVMKLYQSRVKGITNFEDLIQFNEFINYLLKFEIEVKIKENENHHI